MCHSEPAGKLECFTLEWQWLALAELLSVDVISHGKLFKNINGGMNLTITATDNWRVYKIVENKITSKFRNKEALLTWEKT